MTKKGNILGWVFLWWQIPFCYLWERMLGFITWRAFLLFNWFSCWHYKQPVIYTKSTRKCFEEKYGSDCWKCK